jgi:glycosyltransferase involved in cell wall biosynthesis
MRSLWAYKSFADRVARSQRALLRPLNRPATKVATHLMSRWFDERVARWRQFKPVLPQGEPQYDLVFFIPEKARGWILEGICRDIAKEFRGTYTFHFSYSDLPRARGYFISHYSQVYTLACGSPHLFEGKTLVCFTHPRHDMAMPIGDYAKILNSTDYVLCQNSWSTGYLSDLGTDRRKMRVLIRAADPAVFKPHERTGKGKVGFCTAFYDRKRPELVLELVRALPHRQFILVGRNWSQWARFEELKRMPNFEYVDAEYSAYPGLYGKMDVFVSPALLEGGPFPLLESMMCNAVPVASRTGFAPDLIRPGENGFLFETGAPATEVASLVEKAFELKADVASTVKQFTWASLAREIEQMIGLPDAH